MPSWSVVTPIKVQWSQWSELENSEPWERMSWAFYPHALDVLWRFEMCYIKVAIVVGGGGGYRDLKVFTQHTESFPMPQALLSSETDPVKLPMQVPVFLRVERRQGKYFKTMRLFWKQPQDIQYSWGVREGGNLILTYSSSAPKNECW